MAIPRIWDKPTPNSGRQTSTTRERVILVRTTRSRVVLVSVQDLSVASEERELMRRLFALAFGILLGAAAMFVAFKFHVVRIKDDWVFVPKPSASLVDAYVDVREWDTAEWTKHTQLVKALVLTGHADLVRQAVTNRWKGKVFGEKASRNEDTSSDDTTFDWPSTERQ